MRQIVIVGASSQGRVVLEVFQALHGAKILGLLDDDPSKKGQNVHGLTV